VFASFTMSAAMIDRQKWKLVPKHFT